MKNQSQVQKRSTGSNVLIIVLILITLATSAFGIFAWARYQTSVQGESTAQVAKWNFKVTGDKTQTEQVSFLITRTDNNQTVAEGTIAPGTYGEIPIEIDVTGTQTDLVYTISGSVANLPRNLKLYIDSERTQEIVIIDGEQFSKGNYLKLADIGTGEKVITETIYWEWPFETGVTEGDKEANNIIDTEDMGKTMTMALTVEGKQLNGSPLLADLVQVGDYVNYNASSNGPKTFTSDDCLTGTSVSATISTDEAFNSEEKAQWRVLSVDKESGVVELMAVDPTVQKVTLSGGDGFVNAETVLNNIGDIYGKGKGAIGGRSINIEDIEQYLSFDPYTFKSGAGDTGYYGGKRVYNNGQFYKQIKNAEGKIEYETNLTQATNDNNIEIIHTYYRCVAYGNILDNTIRYMLMTNIDNNGKKTNKDYWLASRNAYLNGTHCNYGMKMVNGGYINKYEFLYSTNGGTSNGEHKMVPVVDLETNIQTTGKNANGVWELKVD